MYVDGFNLYYGGQSICGRGTPGWRWLDIRGLAEDICSKNTVWDEPAVERIVYCTARIRGSSAASDDQDTYLRALLAARSVDHTEFGNFVERLNSSPLAVGSANGKPRLVDPAQLSTLEIPPEIGIKLTSSNVMVSYSKREEKGSEVNVASHLLVDVYENVVDGALVVSNDSDLAYAIKIARTKVPVGFVNPSANYLAGKLAVASDFGAGRHFSMQLKTAHFFENQLAEFVGSLKRPSGW